MEMIIIAVLIGSVLLGLYMLKEAFGNTVKVEMLQFPEWPDQSGEFTIFFISDIHRRAISQSIIEKVTGKADIVIIGGDLTEKGVPFSRVKENLDVLSGIAPVYFVWGNNDYEVDEGRLRSLFKKTGVVELKNKVVHNKSVTLIGIDDLTRGYPSVDMITPKTNEQ